MIKLDVDEYCHGCSEFKPEASYEKAVAYKGKLVYSTTYVYCTNREHCNAIKEYLEKKLKGGQDGQA